MYFNASIPIAGPIVLVIPALQNVHIGAPPALLLDQSFITVQENQMTILPSSQFRFSAQINQHYKKFKVFREGLKLTYIRPD